MLKLDELNVGDELYSYGSVFEVTSVNRQTSEIGLLNKKHNARSVHTLSILNSAGVTKIYGKAVPANPPQAVNPTPPLFQVGDTIRSHMSGTIYEVMSWTYNHTLGTYEYELDWNGTKYPGITEGTLKKYTLTGNTRTQGPVPGPTPLARQAVLQGLAESMYGGSLPGAHPSNRVKLTGPCHIVKSSVLNKEFLYCRNHDEEADSQAYCRKASK